MKVDRETTPPDEREHAIQEIKAACAREARWWRVQVWLGAICLIVLIVGALLERWLPHGIVFLIRMLALGGYVLTLSAFSGLTLPSRRQIAALEHAVAARDVRLIGTLVGALPQVPTHAADTRRQVAAALAELLPQVRANDAAGLTPEDRARLVRQLRSSTLKALMERDVAALGDSGIQVKEQRLALAILAALEQIGGEEAVAEVERLSRAEARSQEAEVIRERATACLESLHMRIERERIGRTLLRAVDAAPAELLRPAATGEAEAKVLVRPMEGEEPSQP